MRIRMLVTVTGSFHSVDGGAPKGAIFDVDDANALRYIKNGIAERVDDDPHFPDKQWVKELETEDAVADTGKVETATVTTRRRGRPRKTPAWHDDDAAGFKEVESDH